MKSERLCVKATDPVILVLPDIHFPFQNQKLIDKVIEASSQIKPTHIVQIGDLYDMYTFSRFTKSVDLITPAEELKRGRAGAEGMWKNLKKRNPRAKCFQLLGNHEYRVYKKLLGQAPELESLTERAVGELFAFEGVVTLATSQSELLINDMVFIHGYSGTLGFHMRYFMRPVVHGHTHRGGVVFEKRDDTALFELDCGNLVDVTAVPFEYTETKTKKWLSGYGVIDNKGPRFIAL